MAFSDWDADDTNGSNPFLGGLDGSQAINSSLPDPKLTLQGDDCRLWNTTSGAGTQPHRAVYCIDEILYPDFFQIPDTKAVSVRMWARTFYNNASRSISGAWIGVKTRNQIQVAPGTFLGLQTQGYWFGISGYGDAGWSTPRFAFRAIDSAGNDVGLWSDDFSGYANATWYQLRMDVIPTLNGAVVDRDTIRLYINTNEAAPSWTLLKEFVIQDSQSGWIPWADANANRISFMPYLQTGISGQGQAVYTDSFQALLKNR